MDNITHSLTGAIASKAGPGAHHIRIIFWITLFAANLPDIDFIMQFFGDRMFYMEQHRGLSHSILFAPFLAGTLAIILHLSVKGASFRLIYPYALIGILLHIFFDLITPFGTMVFYPITDYRYTLDLIFIIDPWLTGIMVLTLVLGKWRKKIRRKIIWIGVITIIFYIILAGVNREVVRSNGKEFFNMHGVEYNSMLVLPQPFSMINWVVLVETDDAVFQIFTNAFQKRDEYTVFDYPLIEPNKYIELAEKSDKVKFFRWFSRMPVYEYFVDNDKHVVEYYDLQFIVNPALAERFGYVRSTPFTLRLAYDDEGNLIDYDF